MAFRGIARAICTRCGACSSTAPCIRRHRLLFACCFLLMITCASTIAASELIGDNVCQREERYAVNVTEHFLRNVTVRSFKWCMQVPPRCSTFTNRVINDSRIVEEERIRLVNFCCEAFLPNVDGTKCEPACQVKCNHGKCNDENKCYCDPGFRGEYCETSCDSNRWGRYCRYHCECDKGTCNPEFGTCTCPSGWTGTRCDQQCQPGTFGLNCSHNCSCRPDQICSAQDGSCTNKLKMAVLKKYHTFDTPFLNTTKITKKIDMYLLTTPKTKTTTTAVKTTTPLPIDHISIIKSLVSTEVSTEKDKVTSERYHIRDANDMHEAEAKEVNTKSMNRKVTKSDPTKGKAYFASASVDSRETVSAEVVTNLGNFDTANGVHAANASAILNASIEANNHGGYGFATISFLCIVAALSVGFFIATRFLKAKQEEKKETPSLRTNVTKAKSIFHTPLPEPPQSPFFETPPCAHYHTRIGENNVAVNPRLSFSHSKNGTRNHFLSYIDECVEPAETEELADVFYDQLPSTRGTYKATSAPEPPPPPALQVIPHPTTYASIAHPRNEANKAYVSTTSLQSATALPRLPPEIREQGFQEGNTPVLEQQEQQQQQDLAGENLYDEIPCWTRSTENDALYINTRAENKTHF